MRVLEQIDLEAIEPVAERLGLQAGKRRSLGPCPCCSAERRSRKDKRAPISTFNRDGLDKWKCFACNEGGGVVRLISFAMFGEALQRGDERWGALIRWSADSVLGARQS